MKEGNSITLLIVFMSETGRVVKDFTHQLVALPSAMPFGRTRSGKDSPRYTHLMTIMKRVQNGRESNLRGRSPKRRKKKNM